MFQSVSTKRVKRNKFDLSHEKKMSLNMGELIPIMCMEVVPGDKFRVKSEILIRLAPLLSPMMHRVDVWVHYFFVPNRLIWTEWEDFITGGREGTSAPVWPHITVSPTSDDFLMPGQLSDYLGFSIPAQGAVTDAQKFSALPYRAYQEIYNQYYRDQNLTPEIAYPKTSGEVLGGNITNTMSKRKRCWEKDYFTSALPWAQRGTQVLMPVEAAVTYKKPSKTKTVAGNVDTGSGVYSSDANGNLLIDGTVSSYVDNIASITGTNVTIEDLRRAVRLQEWLEANARGGARYIEQILSHFGVRSSDARLQRPQYLGGGKQPIVVSEVLATAETGTVVDVGDMKGHGISVGESNQFQKFFEEHGFVMGIMSVLPRTAYQQGIPRMLSRSNKLDYYWPEFAHLGEQAVKLKELYYNKDSAPGRGEITFGYQSRYAEYKYVPSTVHGTFRSSMNYWHMGRIFASEPVLNTSFVEADPTTRVFAVTGGGVEHLYAQVYNRVDAIRPMPYFNQPTL